MSGRNWPTGRPRLVRWSEAKARLDIAEALEAERIRLRSAEFAERRARSRAVSAAVMAGCFVAIAILCAVSWAAAWLQ